MVSDNWHSLKAKLDIHKDKEQNDEKAKDLWFDVDQLSLKRSQIEERIASGEKIQISDLFPKPPTSHRAQEIGKYVAMDCEFVGVGSNGTQHALARVSIVNFHGHVLLDLYVKPREQIIDYRTPISGIKPIHMKDAQSFSSVQIKVAHLLCDKTVIGHGLKTDFRVLMLSHPRKLIRDTCKLRKFRAIVKGKTPGLARLAKEFLGIADFHSGEHDSVDDARVAMLLYRLFKDEWENSLFRQEGKVVKEAKRQKKRLYRKSSAENTLLQDEHIEVVTNIATMTLSSSIEQKQSKMILNIR